MEIPQQRIHVLIPDRMERALIEMIGRRQGWQMQFSATPDRLSTSLIGDSPDLLLLDLNLPGQNGLDLLQSLKKEQLLNRTHVIVVSALCFPEVVRQAIAAGANDFLARPLDGDSLVERVEKQLLSKIG